MIEIIKKLFRSFLINWRREWDSNRFRFVFSPSHKLEKRLKTGVFIKPFKWVWSGIVEKGYGEIKRSFFDGTDFIKFLEMMTSRRHNLRTL
ncbi:hypothetical protein D5366_10370 [Neokomagataea tanensis]|uniref:Uncharacterized protein n=1 Tax=Neokomagataea tanensis TaxID=661191 RepID=A0A4Y6VA30_9PROT|nr:hypothetical protein D5366_10370 [Neokomagataea tanensis]